MGLPGGGGGQHSGLSKPMPCSSAQHAMRRARHLLRERASSVCVWVQDHGTARRSGQALRTCVATGCEAANYEAQPAVQRWRSEQPPRGYCTLRHRGQPLRLRVAGFWMPASARQQPTQRRRPAHTSSERRRSTLFVGIRHRDNRQGEYLGNIAKFLRLTRSQTARTYCPLNLSTKEGIAKSRCLVRCCPPTSDHPPLLGTLRAPAPSSLLSCAWHA